MCLIGIALRAHPRYPLAIAANRDEFYARPSAAFGPWPDAPDVFGGRDLQAGGSWLALRGRRLAAVTNVRRMVPPPAGAPSRGRLVRDFLIDGAAAAAYLDDLSARADDFAGFNLLLADGEAAWFASNRPHWQRVALSPGIHVVANASLDTPWPKSERLRAAFAAWCAAGDDDAATLLSALEDETPVNDADLPDTGLPVERERLLAPAFIRSEVYGTRACTIVLYDRDGGWRAIERRYGPNGAPDGESRFNWGMMRA